MPDPWYASPLTLALIALGLLAALAVAVVLGAVCSLVDMQGG